MPFFGIEPQVVNEQGEVLEGEAEGILVLARSWPGQMRTLYNNHERFMEAYFTTFPGKYFAGDGVKRDVDGYYWITGRVDDVLNISGHRLGTAEIESALVLHENVSEAAVVGCPHDIKGQGIYAYVSIMSGVEPTDELKAELVKLVRSEIGPIATVDKIDSLQLTANYQVATPVDWKHGDDCVVIPAIKTEDIPAKFPKGHKVIKPYLRTTPQPDL